MAILDIQKNNISFGTFDGKQKEVATEDGIGEYPISFVFAEVGDKVYVYNTDFLACYKYFEDSGEIFFTTAKLCSHFIEDQIQAGYIDLDHWHLKEEPEFDLESFLEEEYLWEMENKY